MKNVDPSRALAIGAGLVIIALTGAAFWLSYAHLAEVALAHGLGAARERAWAWPATLDLFIVAGELLMLRAALSKRVDGWAIGLTTVGSVGSIVLNVAGVTGTRDPSAVPLLDYVVAAVPPTAALLAFGALMRQVHQALAKRDIEPVVTTEVTTPVTVERADMEPLQVVTTPVIALPAASPMWDDFATSKVTTPKPLHELVRTSEETTRSVVEFDYERNRYVKVGEVPKASVMPTEQTRQVVTEQLSLSPTELRKKARNLHRQVVRSGGRGVTIDQLRDEFGISRREAAELRRQVVTEVAS